MLASDVHPESSSTPNGHERTYRKEAASKCVLTFLVGLQSSEPHAYMEGIDSPVEPTRLLSRSPYTAYGRFPASTSLAIFTNTRVADRWYNGTWGAIYPRSKTPLLALNYRAFRRSSSGAIKLFGKGMMPFPNNL